MHGGIVTEDQLDLSYDRHPVPLTNVEYARQINKPDNL